MVDQEEREEETKGRSFGELPADSSDTETVNKGNPERRIAVTAVEM